MDDSVSRTLQPQEAFDELARITLADHSLDSVMQKVCDLAKRTVPAVDEVSVTLLEGGKARTVAYTGEIALQLDERQYERGYGPCLDGIEANEPVHIASMRTEQRWPAYVAAAWEHGAGSSLTMPIPLLREVAAALNMYATREHAFDEQSIELAGTFSAYAGVALANMHLYDAQARVADQLQAAMASRAVIEQAKGILMATRRCSSQAAFDLLVKLSQDSNRKLRDVAQALVDEAGRPA